MSKDDQPDRSRRRLLKGMLGSLAQAAAGKPATIAAIPAPVKLMASLPETPVHVASAIVTESAAAAVSAIANDVLHNDPLTDPRYRPIFSAMNAWGNYRNMYRKVDASILHKLRNGILNGNVDFTNRDIFILAQRMYGSAGIHGALQGELLNASRALAQTAPTYEIILECLQHPALFDTTKQSLTSGNPIRTAHDLNIIAHMDEGQLQVAYAKEIGARAAELDEMRALLEKLPAIKHRVMQKAGVEITDIPSFGTQYRAKESPIATDYYVQTKPVQWQQRLDNESQLHSQSAPRCI